MADEHVIPNNSYGISNPTYIRYRTQIDRYFEEKLEPPKRGFVYERFARRGLFPTDLSGQFEIATKEDEDTLAFLKDKHPDDYERAARFNFIRRYIRSFLPKSGRYGVRSRRGVSGEHSVVYDWEFENEHPDQNLITSGFAACLDFKLEAVYSDAESIYFTFAPPKEDNDRSSIRLDIDFAVTGYRVFRYRSPEAWSTPYDAKSGLAKIIGQAPLFCWQSINEFDATLDFHACWANGVCLRIAYGFEGYSFVTMDYRTALPTMRNALSYGLGRRDYTSPKDFLHLRG